MSRVCGMIQNRAPAPDPDPGAPAASARTASKNSRGIAVTNRGHTYRLFHSRCTSVTHRAGMTWSDPTGSMTFLVAATAASVRNCSCAARSAASRSGVVCSVQPAP